uniref:Fibronectin type-III domain-containing protein n=1 Tax=Callorhinchus milii TaxID=7868 RepID=A0A4W3JUF9_CALMI
MTCSWIVERHTQTKLKLSISSGHVQVCKPEHFNNFCTIFYPNIHYYVEYTIWVEAENSLGKILSDSLLLDAMDKVKTEPPEIISVQPVGDQSDALSVKWVIDMKLPAVFHLKYDLRYQKIGTTDWKQIQIENASLPKKSFIIEGLKPFTVYTVAIRCMNINGKGYWSEWSLEKNGSTSEDSMYIIKMHRNTVIIHF